MQSVYSSLWFLGYSGYFIGELEYKLIAIEISATLCHISQWGGREGRGRW